MKSNDGTTTTLSTNAQPGSILHEVVKEASRQPELLGGRGAKVTPQSQHAIEMQAEYLQNYYAEKAISIQKLEEKMQKLSEQLVREKEYLMGLADAAQFSRLLVREAEQLTFNFEKSA